MRAIALAIILTVGPLELVLQGKSFDDQADGVKTVYYLTMLAFFGCFLFGI